MTTQPAALPATPSAPITSPELPAYKRVLRLQQNQELPQPLFRQWKEGGARTACWKTDHCAGAALTPGQKKAQAQANQRALQETNELVAAAPLTAQQQMIQQAQASTAGKIESIRGGLETIKTFHPERHAGTA